MNVVFRVDAALHIGSGHVMRCLALADQLAAQDVVCRFICREFDGNLFSLIREKGYELYTLSINNLSLNKTKEQIVPHEHWLGVNFLDDAKQTIAILKKMKITIDWLIIDHYAIDERWESILRPYVKKIMLIDDLADRVHDCDLLLDQNYYNRLDRRYQSFLSKETKILLGPSYSLLRQDFSLYRAQLADYHQRFIGGNIIVFFGGVDLNNETSKALEGIKNSLREQDHVQIILGINNENSEKLKKEYKDFKQFSFHIQINDMAQRMANAYLYIGAIGTTTWERCAMCLPGIVVSVADNQIDMGEELNKINSHIYLGCSNETNSIDYKNAYEAVSNNYKELLQMSKVSGELMSTEGMKQVISIIKGGDL